MSKKKTSLNESQKRAIGFEKGPLLVVAGAGTGKTKVITERIKYLVEKLGVKPEEILALTFTEKASQEMLERVGDIMPLGYQEPYIYTFHSFADRILKTDGIEMGLDVSYKIIPDTSQWLLFRKNLFSFKLSYFRPLGNPTKFISAILKFISRLQDENISPAKFTDFVKNSKTIEPDEINRWDELSAVYEKYQALKIAQSKLDFGDLINKTIELFQTRPNILRKYQNQFKHILVDEFQDTNYSQYELIKLLYPRTETNNARSLVVVGDDSQSIYKFRGAAISNILEFQEDYPKAEMITLTQNYRSNQPILDASYNLIQNNNPDTLESKLGISKKLKSSNQEVEVKPQIYQTNTLEEEVETVIAKILEILGKEPSYTYKDFAILSRANSHLDPFVLGLKKYGIPYQLVGNRGLYDQEEIRNIIALVRLIVDGEDNVNLFRALNINVFEIPFEDISKILSQAKYNKSSVWSICLKSDNSKINNFVGVINTYRSKVTKQLPSELIYELLYSTNYLKSFTETDSIENELALKNLDIFYNIVKRFEVEYRQDIRENPTLLNLVEHLDLMIEAGDNPAQAEIEDVDTINLLTTHASKGLEFKVVFMINLVSDRFPSRNRSDVINLPDELIKEVLPEGDPHIQEERRLFYVGMTRAQKYLYMTFAKNYGGKRDKNPTGFLEETGLKITEIDSSEINRSDSQNSLFGTKTNYRESDKDTPYEPSFVSYTQISNYKTCPLQYKYGYVLKIPGSPSHALSFGNTIHATLKEFHMQLSTGKEVTLNKLLELYDKFWDPIGYISEEHKKERYQSGINILTKYYEKATKEKSKPKALEQSFNIRIDGMRMFGRIDRIDPLPEGGVEIIDYKTGNPKDQKEVDNDDQVAVYAIAAKEALKLDPKKLSLYFVETDQKISTTRTEKQLEDKKKEIAEEIRKIRSGDFHATPGMHCSYCDYKHICPHAYKN